MAASRVIPITVFYHPLLRFAVAAMRSHGAPVIVCASEDRFAVFAENGGWAEASFTMPS
jgi:hypothetical protein